MPAGHLRGPPGVEVEQPGHLQPGLAVGGQVGHVHDGPRPDHGDRQAVFRRDRQVGGGRDGGEDVDHGVTSGRP